MRLKLGILGLLLFGVITVLWKQFNNPPTPGRTLIFLLLSLIPVTLLPYLFVDNLDEMKEPKTSAKVLTLILFLGLFSVVYDGNLNVNFIIQWILLLGIIWLLTVGKTPIKGKSG